MSKLGVIHYNFPGFSLEQFLQFAAETGYKYVELSITDIWDETVEHPLAEADIARQSRRTEAVREQLEKLGLQVSSVAARNDFLQPTAEDLDFQVARMRGIASQVRLLGPDTVLRADGGWDKASVPQERWWPDVESCFQRCLDFIDKFQVTIAIDNHGTVTNNGPKLLELLKRLNNPLIGSNLDTMNYRWAGYSIEECNQFYTDVAPFVKHVHLKDGFGSRAEYKGAALGEGEIDLAHALSALKAANYQGVYCAEYEGKELEGGAGYRKCYEWMQRNLG